MVKNHAIIDFLKLRLIQCLIFNFNLPCLCTERELSHQKRQTSLQKELEMTRGTCTTTDFRFTSEAPPYLLSGQNITRAFSGNDCNNIDGIGYCDHLITQIPPTGFVDNMYIVPPNNDDRDTIIRITAIDKSDIFYMIGAANKSLSLYKSNSFDIRISSNQVCYIESTTPVIVTGIGLASKQVLNLGDPSMAIIPGINQYLNYYKIVIPDGYVNNFVSVMIKESSLDFFRINSTVINICDIVFEENVLAENITYIVKTIRVTEGFLTARTLDGEKFGMVFLGVHIAEAYSFSVNFLLP